VVIKEALHVLENLVFFLFRKLFQQLINDSGVEEVLVKSIQQLSSIYLPLSNKQPSCTYLKAVSNTPFQKRSLQTIVNWLARS